MYFVSMVTITMCMMAGFGRAFQVGIQRSSSFSAMKSTMKNNRRSKTWGYVNNSVKIMMSTISTDTDVDVQSLKGVDFVRNAIVEVLNKEFDYEEVARNVALAKLEPKKKKQKKKKKKKNADESSSEQTNEEPEAKVLSEEEKQAIADAAAADAVPFNTQDTMVTPATKDEFGDYQCNAAMGLARNVNLSPRDTAQKIVDGLQPLIGNVMEEPEIAGPGFINLKFKEQYLSSALTTMAKSNRLAVPITSNKQRIIVDFSSPNIAKEMHVGHLRSTIIGDTLSNLLTFMGHDVTRLNHVGDWGTQFGMLVEHLRTEFPQALSTETSQDIDLGDLVTLYKAAKQRFDQDEEFKTRARDTVVKLQAGDEESLTAWKSLCQASRNEYDKIYDTLNIKGLTERGESFYNPFLSSVVSDLEEQELAVPTEGAKAVFLDGYTGRDGTPLPIIVQKSDGGFNYASTDLAAIRHRTEFEDGENADRVLYVTDAGQAQHFQMVFEVAKLANFVPKDKKVSLEHVPFGLVQGEDGKKFATRSGDTVKLRDLLDEAVNIAAADIQSREDSTIDKDQLQSVATTVGIGAVKYADLSMNRESNYKFSYARMLSLNGNTAPYMLYSYARICGIVRKATGFDSADENAKMEWPEPAKEVLLTHESEVALVRNLVKLPDILNEVESELYPNRLCDYLFETSQKFNKFYENCAVNNAETPELKASRLTLCTVTASTIKLLMGLLGIEVVERL